MTSTAAFLPSLFRRFETNREFQFWSIQLIGWGGLCIVTFLSLTVWYGSPNWRHVSHTLIQAIIGALLTIPLRSLYRKIWDSKLSKQIFVALVSVTLMSAVWTGLRIQVFLWLGEEYDIWKDFGGWYFGSFMVFLSWMTLYFGMKFYLLLQDERLERNLATQRVQEEQLKRLSAETGAREAQIKMLRYQLNPHFLFNTLNSISALVKTDRSDQARLMITQLSDFLRFSLDNDANQKVTLENEIRALNLYLDIEKVRYGKRLKLEFDVRDEIKAALIPSLILQPLVENALKFAVSGRVKGGRIRIQAQLNDNKLKLSVDDNGPGIEEDIYEVSPNLTFKDGVGHKNISERLESHYGNMAGLIFKKSEFGGLSAMVHLPFEEDDGDTETNPVVEQAS